MNNNNFGMNAYTPEIAELLILIEKKYKKSLITTTDFEEFSLYLSLKYGQNISSSTLKRLWGYVNDIHKPRIYTLDILSKYIGYQSFNDFCYDLKKSEFYNSSFFSSIQIQSHELSINDVLEIGWSPNRVITIRFDGNSNFTVLSSVNSKLQSDDKFEAVSFIYEQPLYLPYVIRDGKKLSAFIAGRNSGLTLIRKV